MAQVLAKGYECLTCHKPIKIAKLDNVPAGQKKKWERFELDGVTPHQCKKKEQQEEAPAGTKTIFDNDPQIAALAEQVKDLKETVNLLLAYDAVDSKHHNRVEWCQSTN